MDTRSVRRLLVLSFLLFPSFAMGAREFRVHAIQGTINNYTGLPSHQLKATAVVTCHKRGLINAKVCGRTETVATVRIANMEGTRLEFQFPGITLRKPLLGAKRAYYGVHIELKIRGLDPKDPDQVARVVLLSKKVHPGEAGVESFRERSIYYLRQTPVRFAMQDGSSVEEWISRTFRKPLHYIAEVSLPQDCAEENGSTLMNTCGVADNTFFHSRPLHDWIPTPAQVKFPMNRKSPWKKGEFFTVLGDPGPYPTLRLKWRVAQTVADPAVDGRILSKTVDVNYGEELEQELSAPIVFDPAYSAIQE